MSDIESLATRLAQLRPKQPREAVRAVATDLVYSGEPEAALAEPAVIDRLFARFNTAQRGPKQVQANDPTTCPICKTTMRPVKLDNEVPAVYCNKHFVVYPARPAEQS
jgi:hypothetical protein